MSSEEFLKDPSARLDYQVDWTDWLDGDTISEVAWTLEDGITNYSTSNTTAVATIWISGGTHGVDYTVTCQITTAGGRINQHSFKLMVREQ